MWSLTSLLQVCDTVQLLGHRGGRFPWNSCTRVEKAHGTAEIVEIKSPHSILPHPWRVSGTSNRHPGNSRETSTAGLCGMLSQSLALPPPPLFLGSQIGLCAFFWHLLLRLAEQRRWLAVLRWNLMCVCARPHSHPLTPGWEHFHFTSHSLTFCQCQER